MKRRNFENNLCKFVDLQTFFMVTGGTEEVLLDLHGHMTKQKMSPNVQPS